MTNERPDPAATGSGFDQQRFLRDLTSLFALPAFWSGSEPAFVLRTLLESLESVLPVEVTYGVAAVRSGARLQLLRVRGQPESIPDPAWADIVAFADVEPIAETRCVLNVRGQALQFVRLPIGYVGEVGRLVVGSSRSGFPDVTDTIVLRSALSLVGAGLETARLIRERDDAQRAKDEFLAVLGHELRNPLAPIVTALQLMARRAGADRPRELDIVERQVHHLRRLVDDLLDVSRITRGTIDLRLERLEVADIVARAIETVAPLMERRQHDVRVQVPRGLWIDGDATRMTQVVANLLTNAAKYTAPGGRVDVSAEVHHGWITIHVLDSGVGLSAELLPVVFDLFVQGRQNLARSEGGLGIGLALVRQLVQAHGGTVGARSDGAGRGSEFTIRLPECCTTAVQDVDAPTGEPDWSQPAEAAARVLVVDDNRDAAELAAKVLATAGHDVEVAYSGLDALQRAERTVFDVIVLDIGLPDLDGYAVADELRAPRFPGARRTRVIALTGYGQASDRARSRDAGFAAHLVKPIDPARLVHTVRHLLSSVATEHGDAAPIT